MDFMLKNNKRIIAIVEARMGSLRLPGKHLLEVLGKPMLGYLIDRLKTVESLDDIVIATTTNSNDDVLVEFAEKNEVDVYRGSEHDVMGRVLDAAKFFKADVICEVTGDSSIIDPTLIEQLIQTYLICSAVYVSNINQSLPDGMGSQIFSTAALLKSEGMTNDPLDREHVTLHIKNNPGLFPSIYIGTMPSMVFPGLAVTLDEKEDYELLKKIIEHFGNKNQLFSCLEVVQLIKIKPNWLTINGHINRKGNS
jgi:spore coat polysaccharide biosynthesis protein SpsF